MRKITWVAIVLMMVLTTSCANETYMKLENKHITRSENTGINDIQDKSKADGINNEYTVFTTSITDVADLSDMKALKIADNRYLLNRYSIGKRVKSTGFILVNEKGQILYQIQIKDDNTIELELYFSKEELFVDLEDWSSDKPSRKYTNVDIATGHAQASAFKNISEGTYKHIDISRYGSYEFYSTYKNDNSIMKSKEIESKILIKPHDPVYIHDITYGRDELYKGSVLVPVKIGEYFVCLRVNQLNGVDTTDHWYDFVGVYDSSWKKVFSQEEERMTSLHFYADRLMLVGGKDVNIYDIYTGKLVCTFNNYEVSGLFDDECFISSKPGQSDASITVKAIDLKKILEKTAK
jgi:hypothetical protein